MHLGGHTRHARVAQVASLYRPGNLAVMTGAAIFTVDDFQHVDLIAASLHLAASVPNLIGHGHALMSHLRIKEDILREDSFQYEGKNMLVPQECVGLGVKIDEEKLAKRTLERFVLEIEK